MATRKKQNRQRRAPRNQKDKGIPFSCRLRPATRTALEAAARRNGRTTSAEADFLLDFALSGRGKTNAVMALVADAIDGLARRKIVPAKESGKLQEWPKIEGKTWLNDGYLHAQALKVVETAFNLMKPAATNLSVAELEEAGGAFLGQARVESLWHEMRVIDAASKKLTANQRRLLALRAGMGSLPDKIMLWGVNGRDARRQNTAFAAMSKSERREFDQLSRKQQAARAELEGKGGVPMDPADAERWLELWGQLGIKRPGGAQ